jgi:hypothetical protein
MGISRKISKAMEASSWIRKMFEEGALLKKEKGEENVYDFTLGNPITEPPKAFGDKLKALAADSTPGTHAYMPNSGLVGVREKIAAYLKAQTGLPYAFNHITMTVGAAGGLNVTLKALLDPGDEVLTLSPFFVEYGVYADNHGGILKPVPTTEDFLPDLEKLAAAITPATKALIINSPKLKRTYCCQNLTDSGCCLFAGGCLLTMTAMRRKRMNISIPTLAITAVILLTACTTPSEPPPPDCSDEGFTIIPTPTRQTDPDLFTPPATPAGGDDAAYCPTALRHHGITESRSFLTTN